ncbi:hypothetical protein BDZ97DRAFT_1670266 [Flammula alnicola]|nr:hypothetical protein BDZ97DRAFT_1670266 [Flammula alnicola]
MSSVTDINLHLSYQNEQIVALTIPIDDIKRLSLRPPKWLRYVAFAVFGAPGRLALTSDANAPDVDYDVPLGEISGDYYYIPDGELHLVDYQALNGPITSSVSSDRPSKFHTQVKNRDASCVFTRNPGEDCDAAHILPRCKGNEYIQAVYNDRLPVYHILYPSIYPSPEPESYGMDDIDCIENGILLEPNLHGKLGRGKIALLKTPNFALKSEDVPRVERDTMPDSRITLQYMKRLSDDILSPVLQYDAKMSGSGTPPPSTIILDYMYGVAAFKRWPGGSQFQQIMKDRFEEHYKSIPPRPWSPSGHSSDDEVLDGDPADPDYRPGQGAASGGKHRRRHHCHASKGMLRAMDGVLGLSMFIKGNTRQSLAADRERRMKEGELQAQEAGRAKVDQWLHGQH